MTNARTISQVLIKDVDRPHPTINLLFMQFGQFLTHDVSQSASIRTRTLFSIFFALLVYFQYFFSAMLTHFVFFFFTDEGSAIRCCSKDGRHVLPRDSLHFACLPIILEPDDEFYAQFEQGCMNFVRSALAPDGQCQLSYGKQVHFIVKTMKIFTYARKESI